MSNYPPGVTGNEPQITGEWPCDVCGGIGYEEDEDGKSPCVLCNGTGIIPEDVVDESDTIKLIQKCINNGFGFDVQLDIDYDGYGNMLVVMPYTKIDGTTWLKED